MNISKTLLGLAEKSAIRVEWVNRTCSNKHTPSFYCYKRTQLLYSAFDSVFYTVPVSSFQEQLADSTVLNINE
jgi:hypothetical protein